MSSKKPCLVRVILILDANIEVEMYSFSEETYWGSGVSKGKSKTSLHTAVLVQGGKAFDLEADSHLVPYLLLRVTEFKWVEKINFILL